MARTHYVGYVHGRAYTDRNHPEKTGAYSYSISIPGGTTRRCSGYDDHTTKDRMELTGIIGIINDAPENSEVTIYGTGDVVNYIASGASKRWKENGWKASNNKPISNVDLWSKMAPICKARNILPKFVAVAETSKEHAAELIEVNRRASKQQSDHAYFLLSK